MSVLNTDSRNTDHVRRVELAAAPGVAADVLADTIRQEAPTGLGQRWWGLASGRVVANHLVAHGSALRRHAVCAGALVRTQESLTFQHVGYDPSAP